MIESEPGIPVNDNTLDSDEEHEQFYGIIPPDGPGYMYQPIYDRTKDKSDVQASNIIGSVDDPRLSRSFKRNALNSLADPLTIHFIPF